MRKIVLYRNMSLKEKAFALFDKGFGRNDPEVKKLIKKAGTRYGYYKRWCDGEGARRQNDVPTTKVETIKPLKDVGVAETLKEETLTPQEEEKQETEDIPPDETPHNGKKPKFDGTVIGQGITITTTISVKTLALYQIAATSVGGELTMGDFIDTCVEDVYRGRGKDLGIINLGGDGHAG